MFSQFIHTAHLTPLKFLACDRLLKPDTGFSGDVWEKLKFQIVVYNYVTFREERGKKMKNK